MNINSIWIKQFNLVVLTKTYVIIFIKLDGNSFQRRAPKHNFVMLKFKT